MMPKSTYFNWSSGKDSSMALFKLLMDKNYKVEYLLTTISEKYQRVSMHGLRRDLLEAQIKQIGIPFKIVELPDLSSNEEYKEVMRSACEFMISENLNYSAFGDIFLEDLRVFREEQLHKVGISALFPLWKLNTSDLAKTFESEGFKAIVVSVNAQLLGEEFVGRYYDSQFIADLPLNVDPCGENGEFHTFCFDGPIFKNPVDFEIGEKILKSYKHGDLETAFWYCDLLPSK